MPNAIRSTLVLATACLLAGTGSASAQGLGTSRAYMKLFGGVTIPQDDSFTLDIEDEDSSSSLDYDAGYVFGIAGGYNVTPNLALELEFAYRVADSKLDYEDGVDGQTKANNYMANAVYSFNPIDAAGAVKPFVGVGLGVTDLKYEPDGGSRLGGDLTFSYQAIAGIGYQVNESWTLSGEVRYLGVNEQNVSASFGNFDTRYQTVDALVGATYRF